MNAKKRKARRKVWVSIRSAKLRKVRENSDIFCLKFIKISWNSSGIRIIIWILSLSLDYERDLWIFFSPITFAPVSTAPPIFLFRINLQLLKQLKLPEATSCGYSRWIYGSQWALLSELKNFLKKFLLDETRKTANGVKIWFQLDNAAEINEIFRTSWTSDFRFVRFQFSFLHCQFSSKCGSESEEKNRHESRETSNTYLRKAKINCPH